MPLPCSFAQTSYPEGLRRMEAARQREEESFLFFEHPPTITLGKSSRPEDLLFSEKDLLSRGYALFQADRGGRATYHGPGQLVGYPVVRLRGSGIGVRRFVRSVAEGLCDYLRSLGIFARYDEERPGLWIGEAKIAALGFSVSRGMTGHGFALNLSCDLEEFRVIRPCGLDAAVASVKNLLGWAPSPAEAFEAVAEAVQTRLG